MYKILVVEDEEILRNSIRHSILSYNLDFSTVDVATNGSHALQILKNDLPDIILSDIRMPSMSGLDLAKHVKEYFPSIHFVLFSAYNDFAYAQEAIGYGVKAYLSKPLKDMELKRTLERIIIEIKNSSNNEEKQNNLKKIIHGADIEKIRAIAPKLSSHSYFRAVVCVFKNKNLSNTETYTSLTNSFCSKNSIPFLWYYDNIVLFLATMSPLTMKKTLAMINSYICSPYLTNEIVVGIGDQYTSVDRFQTSYNQAVFAASCYYFSTYSRIIFHQSLHKHDYSALDDDILNTIVSKIIKSTFLYDKQSVLKSSNSFFNNISSRGAFSIDHIQTKCLEILFEISHQLRDRGFDTNILNKNKTIEEIKNNDNIKQLQQWFEETMNNIIKKMTEHQTCKIDLITEAQKYIENHYFDRLTLEHVAEHIHISPVYFSAAFKKKLKINFTEYVNNVRIRVAKNMLLDPSIRIKDIYCKIGFSDYSYFCRVFKKKTGISPKKYRTQKLMNQ